YSDDNVTSIINTRRNIRKSSLVEDLLVAIYRARSADSGANSALGGDSDTLTEYSTTSEVPYYRSRAPTPNYESCSVGPRKEGYHRRSHLHHKDVSELQHLATSIRVALNTAGAMVVRELKRREKLRQRRDRQNDVITAILHALSQKRS
ncbi:unnamed protein product, partial [Meganyctiphanes norvegica]